MITCSVAVVVCVVEVVGSLSCSLQVRHRAVLYAEVRALVEKLHVFGKYFVNTYLFLSADRVLIFFYNDKI